MMCLVEGNRSQEMTNKARMISRIAGTTSEICLRKEKKNIFYGSFCLSNIPGLIRGFISAIPSESLPSPERVKSLPHAIYSFNRFIFLLRKIDEKVR